MPLTPAECDEIKRLGIRMMRLRHHRTVALLNGGTESALYRESAAKHDEALLAFTDYLATLTEDAR